MPAGRHKDCSKKIVFRFEKAPLKPLKIPAHQEPFRRDQRTDLVEQSRAEIVWIGTVKNEFHKRSFTERNGNKHARRSGLTLLLLFQYVRVEQDEFEDA